MKFSCLATIFFSLSITFGVHTQTSLEPINSKTLGVKRDLKIQLPRNYNTKTNQNFPLVIVLNGEYLFEPVAGNIDYQSYWEDIPDCIVVGIDQSNTAEDDFLLDGEASSSGLKFMRFIKEEVIKHIESQYRTTAFRIIVGHDNGANFTNHFLVEHSNLFSAYVVLSPNLDEVISQKLKNKIQTLSENNLFYLATAENDLKDYKQNTNTLNTTLNAIKNTKFNYQFNNFKDANHFSLVGLGIAKALNHFFALYKPINREEYKTKVLTYKGSPYDYLIHKYQTIKEFYGFEKKTAENDIRAIIAASDKKDDVTSLENITELIREEYPDSMLKAYYSGLLYEKKNDLKNALIQYQSGLFLKPSQSVDKDMLLDKIYTLKKN